MQPAASQEKKPRVLEPRAPAPRCKGLCNLLPVAIFSSLCRSEYIYINEVKRKLQIIASELANDHAKDDEDKSRGHFLLPLSCFCSF